MGAKTSGSRSTKICGEKEAMSTRGGGCSGKVRRTVCANNYSLLGGEWREREEGKVKGREQWRGEGVKHSPCTLEGASNIEVKFMGTYRPGVVLHGGNTPTH